jgi:membrane associated rhomboid family serine protease
LLIPIRHENMSARRWPVITVGLIALNTLIFLATQSTLQQESPELGKAKAHILLLAAQHPELKLADNEQKLVDSFRASYPAEWARTQSPTLDVVDAWDAQMRMAEDPARLQSMMDDLADQYSKLSTAAISEQYAFVPAHPNPISYLTANFLHGGWLHLIGNMWFLWLAGFVLEDVWGRWLYTAFYLVAGAAALQIHAWANTGSIIPTLGASGAVAALMGAFLVRFPKMKIEMLWLFGLGRTYRFQSPAYWLLPLWLLAEVFYGTIFGATSSVAHWAHVGGFVFGALGALAIQHSGLERTINRGIEEKTGYAEGKSIEEAKDHLNHGRLNEAFTAAHAILATTPNSVEALAILRDLHWRRGETEAQQNAILKLCAAHIKTNDIPAALEDYDAFLQSAGSTDNAKLPAALLFDLARGLESHELFGRALEEFEKFLAAYPAERQSLPAQLAAARICLKKLDRPADALRFYQAADRSAIPHLDWDSAIQSGIRDAEAALAKPRTAAATR